MLKKIFYSIFMKILIFSFIFIFCVTLILNYVFQQSILPIKIYNYIIFFIYMYFDLLILIYIFESYDLTQITLGKKHFIMKLVIILCVLVVLKTMGKNLYDIFTIVRLLSSVLFLVDSRLSATISLNLMWLIPYYLIIGNGDLANSLSIYGYYFLIITFVNGVIENKLLSTNNIEKD